MELMRKVGRADGIELVATGEAVESYFGVEIEFSLVPFRWNTGIEILYVMLRG